MLRRPRRCSNPSCTRARCSALRSGGIWPFVWLADRRPRGRGDGRQLRPALRPYSVEPPRSHFVRLGSPRSQVGLFESGRPILLSPPAPPKQIATNVLIAWNGSTEQTRAIAFAMPLLQQAESVKVLTIPGGAGVPGPSGEQLTRSLARNGLVATLLTVELDGRSTGETILATAASQDCDLLIKGAYTQSRLRQLIFGGATRHILANATLPVFMAH